MRKAYFFCFLFGLRFRIDGADLADITEGVAVAVALLLLFAAGAALLLLLFGVSAVAFRLRRKFDGGVARIGHHFLFLLSNMYAILLIKL